MYNLPYPLEILDCGQLHWSLFKFAICLWHPKVIGPALDICDVPIGQRDSFSPDYLSSLNYCLTMLVRATLPVV